MTKNGKPTKVIMKKTDVIDAINEMPKEFDSESLIERLVFMEKVEEDLKQAEDGKTVTHEKVKEMVSKW